jgi:hypothetical protein
MIAAPGEQDQKLTAVTRVRNGVPGRPQTCRKNFSGTKVTQGAAGAHRKVGPVKEPLRGLFQIRLLLTFCNFGKQLIERVIFQFALLVTDVNIFHWFP